MNREILRIRRIESAPEPDRATVVTDDGRRISARAPETGGYVTIGGEQYCEAFSSRGPTLLWQGPKSDTPTLAEYLRRERRKARRRDAHA